jgi:hypothetical protein
MQAGASAGAASREAVMQPSQDIGVVRRELVHQVLAAQHARPGRTHAQTSDADLLRELLDEAHARIRTLEKAIERMAAAV